MPKYILRRAAADSVDVHKTPAAMWPLLGTVDALTFAEAVALQVGKDVPINLRSAGEKWALYGVYQGEKLVAFIHAQLRPF